LVEAKKMTERLASKNKNKNNDNSSFDSNSTKTNIVDTTTTTTTTNNNNTTNTTDTTVAADFSFFSFWKDPNVKHKSGVHLWQSGQIMFSKELSVKCLDAWKNEMDNKKHVMDQLLLFNVYEQNFTDHRCLFFELPQGAGAGANNSKVQKQKQQQQRQHFQLLSGHITDGTNRSQYPTIVHLTQTSVRRVNRSQYRSQYTQFLRKSLFLEDLSSKEEKDALQQHQQQLVVDRKSDTGVISWNSTTVSWDEIIDTF